MEETKNKIEELKRAIENEIENHNYRSCILYSLKSLESLVDLAGAQIRVPLHSPTGSASPKTQIPTSCPKCKDNIIITY